MQAGSSFFSQIASRVFSIIDKKILLWLAVILFVVGTGYALYQPVHPDPWHIHSSWDRFIYPQEKNAFLRQPSIGSNINDVTAIDGQLWAVGDGGLILHSSDGGLCWTPKGPWVSADASSTCPNPKTGLQRVFSGLSASAEKNRLLDALIPTAHAADAPKAPELLKEDIKKKPRRLPVKKPVTATKSVIRQDIRQEIPEQKPLKLDIDVKAEVDVKVTQQVAPAQPVIPDLHSIVFIDSDKGVAVGGSGAVIRTNDGGASWRPVTSASDNSLLSVAVIDRERLVAVGAQGTILRSTDGGESWQPAESRSRSSLSSVTVVDPDHLVAVGDNDVILLSTDGGKSWQSRDSGTRNSLAAITAVDEERLIIVGDKGTILLSTNKGESWQTVESGTQDILVSIVVIDREHLVAVGGNGTIVRSTDRGANWQPASSGTQDLLRSISVVDRDRLVAVGQGGIILHSTDAGETWQPAAIGTRGWLNAIAVVDSGQLIAVGQKGSILRSTNGGESWRPVPSGTIELLTSITVVDRDHLIAAGSNGVILHSTDGGKSWQPVVSGSGDRISSITAINRERLVAVTEGGDILRSIDGGSSWQVAPSGERGRLYSIVAIDYEQLVAAGGNGTILRSDDSGASWKLAASATRGWLTAITAIDRNRLVAVGFKGTVVLSTDGGKRWRPIPATTVNRLYSVAAVNSDQVIAVGDHGTILRSNDGGASWQPAKAVTSDSLRSITVVDQEHLVTVGYNRAILRSSNAGETWTQVADYQVQIALWWYLLMAVTIGLVLFIVWPRIEPATDDGIAGLAASDKPLQPGDPDALDLSSIAADITAFLSNPKTTAPLTMAITGPWGSGKSSLMNLVRADLKKRGFSPVWFNAWHHQKGEQLLASLFAHIKDQAIPSLFSFDGLWFRLKLAYLRSKQHWFLFIILVGLLFFTLSFYKQDISSFLMDLVLLSNPKLFWEFPWANYMPSFENLFRNGDWLQTLASVFGIGTPLLAFLRSIRGFGINPAKLVSVDHRHDSGKGYDPGARARFAGEFKDVTRALGNNKMVIFIDDLDRCSQDNLIDILENINFISSSGDCFLLVGMAPKYIEACVANAYQTLAESIAEKEKHEQQDHFEDTETHKFRFAHNYLEKMINIMVPVPAMQDTSINSLFTPQAEEPPELSWKERTQAALLGINRSAPLLLLALMLIVAIWYGWEYGRRIPDRPKPPPKTEYDLGVIDRDTLLNLSRGRDFDQAVQKLLDAERDGDKPTVDFSLALSAEEKMLRQGIRISSLGQGRKKAELLLRLNRRSNQAQLVEKPVNGQNLPSDEVNPVEQTGQKAAVFRQATFESGGRLSGLKLLFGTLIFAALAFSLYRKKRDKYARDSNEFKQALSEWTPWIQSRQQTPRAVKRFLNHLRFLAVRNRRELEEPVLVAMATVYFYKPDWLLDERKFDAVCQQQIFPLLALESRIEELNTEEQAGLTNILNDLSAQLTAVIEKTQLASMRQFRETAVRILHGALPVTHSPITRRVDKFDEGAEPASADQPNPAPSAG